MKPLSLGPVVISVCLGLLAFKACIATTPSNSFPSAISNLAISNSDWIVSVRRELHQVPELGGSEVQTGQIIKRTLQELSIPYKEGVVKTGLVGTVGKGEPVVALRADIDALPIQEPEGLLYRSQNEGRMHACGHDAHTSMLLGAAKLLKNIESDIQGTVKLVFQPNEEFGAGGDHVVKEGILDDVHAAFALHVWPSLPSGQLGTRAGTIMAGALSFHITVTGRGGHAAMPHLNSDPIVASSALISALQTLVSRETSPLGSAVLSVTLLRAGTAYNVIPDTSEIGGTIRGLDHELLLNLQVRVEQMSSSVAAGFGCSASVDWRLNQQPYYPPTVNDAGLARMARQVAEAVLGRPNHVLEVEPSMAGEDFAFFCRKVPCTLGFLGTRNESEGAVHGLHTPRFKLDESILYKGAALHTAWAMEFLRRHSQAGHASALHSGGSTGEL